jgi:hypothetical protein
MPLGVYLLSSNHPHPACGHLLPSEEKGITGEYRPSPSPGTGEGARRADEGDVSRPDGDVSRPEGDVSRGHSLPSAFSRVDARDPRAVISTLAGLPASPAPHQRCLSLAKSARMPRPTSRLMRPAARLHTMPIVKEDTHEFCDTP